MEGWVIYCLASDYRADYVSDLPGGRTTYLGHAKRFGTRQEATLVAAKLQRLYYASWRRLVVVSYEWEVRSQLV